MSIIIIKTINDDTNTSCNNISIHTNVINDVIKDDNE